MTYSPTLLAERSRSEQVLVAGLIPAVIGGVAGVLIGVSSGGYWVVAALAAVVGAGLGAVGARLAPGLRQRAADR